MSLEAMVKVNGDSSTESYDVEEFGHVSVQDEDGNTVIISEDEQGNISVYYADHASMTIEGEAKSMPQVTVDSDEYPFDLTVMDSEDAVGTLRMQNLNI